MSIEDLRKQAPAFLTEHIPQSQAQSSDKPHITVTWAQSLDFKIAGPGGRRVMLSGDESMLMTHWYVLMSPYETWSAGK